MPDTTVPEPDLLDESSVGPYLVERGVLPDGPTTATTLAGGVSNVVLQVSAGDTVVVVKQARERLRVADDWRADPARSQAEAEALRVLGALTPDAVPHVIDADPDRHTLTISAAPGHWTTWKTELLAGTVRAGVAGELGALLAEWHRSTAGAPLDPLLERTDLFDQLRLNPYFGTAATRRPAFATRLADVTAEVRRRRRCLVLGDFSPKNILVGDDGTWVIDLEVAHRGDPAFDVGFLLCHLIAKSVHRTDRNREMLAAAERFLFAYGTGFGADDAEHLSRVLGALLVARVAGSSPLEYLSPDSQRRVESIGSDLLVDPAPTIDELIVRAGAR